MVLQTLPSEKIPDNAYKNHLKIKQYDYPNTMAAILQPPK